MLLRSPFDLVYLLCAIQGAITCALLFSRRENRVANRILAVGVGAITVSAAYVLYMRSGLYRDHPRFLFFIEPLQLLFGPVFWLYVSALVGTPGRPRRTLHFVPFFLLVAGSAPRLFASGEAKLALLIHERASGPSLLQSLVQLAIELHGAAYLALAVRMLAWHRRALETERSDVDEHDLRWLRRLLGSLLVLWVGSTLAFVTRLPILPWVHVGITIVVYAIAYRRERGPVPAPPAKYRKSRLKEDEVRLVLARLAAIFDDARTYCDPDLTLAALANRIGVPPHQLSQILNERLLTTFHDYVNHARVEEVKRRLMLDPDASILAIAFECGFASKSSFNANFRKHAGESPSAFRAALASGAGTPAGT